MSRTINIPMSSLAGNPTIARDWRSPAAAVFSASCTTFTCF
jgi:hypothetical protein